MSVESSGNFFLGLLLLPPPPPPGVAVSVHLVPCVCFEVNLLLLL